MDWAKAGWSWRRRSVEGSHDIPGRHFPEVIFDCLWVVNEFRANGNVAGQARAHWVEGFQLGEHVVIVLVVYALTHQIF